MRVVKMADRYRSWRYSGQERISLSQIIPRVSIEDMTVGSGSSITGSKLWRMPPANFTGLIPGNNRRKSQIDSIGCDTVHPTDIAMIIAIKGGPQSLADFQLSECATNTIS